MTKFEYSILPEYAPLYPKLPYRYHDYQKISVYCKADREKMQKLLPKEFKVAGDVLEVFVLRNNEIEGLDNYSEGGLIIPCSYKDITGACMSFEYVDSDDALCAGREIWGYPKKLGDIQFIEEEKSITGTVSRKGKEIINIHFEEAETDFTQPNLFPRLQVKRMPHPEKDGTDLNTIIKNGFYDSVIKSKVTGKATLKWENSLDDPLSSLGPVEVVGSVYVVGSFTLSYGEIVEDLQK
ncbi:acetoacetate decarboxylase family protein [Cytobacillus purgationiresistens]|uniref:Acetoacetate decarboxylase n=1 Tax=Cytobacillus purgationiresistens TaxID=863449 RepID=A0ABU0AEB8_9BACI|nr:acetoacetate decarboxylase family protein [Cytobacillus purgationiresistens]MDQ0269593.1 acetoacetate decarboxylase [Cytobacillus purgationiresistens]